MARTKQIKPEIQFFPKRLMQRLQSIKTYPLTLVEAPSGFGKTTALHHFFDSQISSVAKTWWHTFISANLMDSWKAFCSLIGKVDPESAEKLLFVGSPDYDNLAEIKTIFQELRCTTETYLILDDFTMWKFSIPAEFLMALSDHGGKELHIVVASQLLTEENHHMILPNNKLMLLQAPILTFSSDDIDAYYLRAGILLTASQLKEVTEITEGWVMALYLQMMTFIENGRFEEGGMQNLIRKAIWNQLTRREREFLTAISIFPRFSLAQAKTFFGGNENETEKLLREKRVFVHFDREIRQFYLHNLFHKFLIEQFELLAQSQQKSIYLMGGDLADKAEDRTNTLRFYYLSGEWERILSLPLTSYEIADIVDENTKPMILDIMENTPFEIKRKYPSVMVPMAFALFFLHENQKLLQFKDEIYEVIEKSDLLQYEKDALLGEMELLLSFLQYNRIDAMSVHHRRALEFLKGPATLINIKSTWTFGSPSVFYLYHRESGKLDEELMQMDQCMPVYYQLTKGHGSGAEIIMRAEAHLMRGEPREAEILCYKAIFTADGKCQNSIVQCGLFLLARIALLKGDRSMLQAALRSLEERSYENTEDLCRYTVDLAKGFINLRLGQWDHIPLWINEGEINNNRLVIMTQPFAHIIYGGILLEKRKYEKLLGVSQFGLEISSIFPNLLPQIYIHIYMAKALEELGKRSEAMDLLQRGIHMVLDDRIYLPFAENYDHIKMLLPEACEDEDFLNKVNTLAQRLNKGISAFRERRLTPREKEILILLKRDMTNKQIGERLYLSPNTIRNIISGMLGKYGYASREQLKQLPDEK